MKKVFSYLINFSLISLTVFGTILAAHEFSKQDEFHKHITMNSDGELNQDWKMNVSGIYPGQSVVYSIDFSTTLDSSYYIELSFVPTGDISLAQYINTNINFNDNPFSNNILKSYLDGETVTIKNGINKCSISIAYTMLESAGNEAQNLAADFLLSIDIKSEVLNNE